MSGGAPASGNSVVGRQQNWRAVAGDIVEVVRKVGPRVAYAGFVCAGVAAVPTIIRYASVFG